MNISLILSSFILCIKPSIFKSEGPRPSKGEIYANFSYELFNINKSEIKPESDQCLDVLKRRSWLPIPLLPSATRNMVMFLKIIKPWRIMKNEQTEGETLAREKETTIDKALKKEKEAAIEALAQVFNNSLYNGGIQTDDLFPFGRV